MLITLDLNDHDRCRTGLDLALTVVAFEQTLEIVFVHSSSPTQGLDLSPYHDKLVMLKDMGVKRVCVYDINNKEIATQHELTLLSKNDVRGIVQQHPSSVSF